MASSSLHDVAKGLLPTAAPEYKEVLSKVSRLYVAILRHDVSHQPGDDLTTEHFVWIKGNQKLLVAPVLAAYRAKCEIGELPITLKAGDMVLDDNTRMMELPMQDQMVVLHAIGPQSEQPPVNSSFSSGLPSSQSSRTPLQPVHRQLTMPPNASQEDQHLKATPDRENMAIATPTLGPRFHSADLNAGTATVPTIKAEDEELRRKDSPAAQVSPLFEPQSAQPKEEPAQSAPIPKDEPQDDQGGLPETQAYEPRDQGNPFANSQDEELEPKSRGQPLNDLSNETTPERLEAGVAAGLQVLAKIEAPLKSLGDNEDAQNWLKQIDNARKEAVKSKTVVGVVGNTGAGKSSVINAMLEEERLVPTNCMRACTAVVTEMSYNNSTNPNAKYRAEIEFIQPEDWRKELRVLFSEIFDDGGNFSREISTPDSEAAIAYAKIRAVYHRHTREMLQESSVESLMKVKHVQSVLGNTSKISQSDPSMFYRRLQQYVDSKEKNTEKLDKNGKKKSLVKREFEYWPLIKVVRIFTKAAALSTGAVIVDLPGVHDSNAARAAVAEGYMKQCTGLWIVAPINRAVDDKAAKTLLGNTFKRQLKFDGIYSAVTFICSKTDDISYTEAMDSLDLGDKVEEIDSRLAEVTSKKSPLLNELKEARATKNDYDDTIEQVDEEIDVWEELAADLSDGKTVYPPTQKKRKRKSASPDRPTKRRRRAIDSDDDDDFVDEQSDDMEDCSTDSGQAKEALTEEAVERKLDELKQLKREARQEKRNIDTRIREIRTELDSLDDEEDRVSSEKNALCIAGRNEYSRGAIRQDFAAGIRELDEEEAEEADPDHFNPEEAVRDYEEVAAGLPVFCVSSRAYQKLSGRLKKDSEVSGFTAIEQTEIPQLQAHCQKLTVKGRQAGCRRFLNSLKQLLTSLGLWASDDGSGIKLTAQQKDAEAAFLARKLKELEKALEKATTNVLDDAVETLQDQLFSKFGPAVQAAVDDAVGTSTGWGAKKHEGGLLWATYRATVRRNGVFAGAAGPRDFNSELGAPIYKQLATAWEKAFQRRLPHILQAFTISAGNVLKNFHGSVEQRSREKGHGIARIAMLRGQLDAYRAIFKDLSNAAVEQLNEGQRELNRQFVPFIGEVMAPTYEWCSEQSGPGVFNRMKSAVNNTVAQQKEQMFRGAAEQVRKGLLELCDTIKKGLLDRADGVFVQMRRDYLTLLGGQRANDVSMSREERAIRRQIDELLDAADDNMKEVVAMDLDELKMACAVGDNDGQDAGNDVDEEIQVEVEGVDSDEDADAEEGRSGAEEQGDANDDDIAMGDD